MVYVFSYTLNQAEYIFPVACDIGLIGRVELLCLFAKLCKRCCEIEAFDQKLVDYGYDDKIGTRSQNQLVSSLRYLLLAIRKQTPVRMPNSSDKEMEHTIRNIFFKRFLASSFPTMSLPNNDKFREHEAKYLALPSELKFDYLTSMLNVCMLNKDPKGVDRYSVVRLLEKYMTPLDKKPAILIAKMVFSLSPYIN